jgi:carbamoylphosphate synthase large subunit
VAWSLRISPDGKVLDLTGTDTEKTSLELNRWIDNAYIIPNAASNRYTHVLNKLILKKGIQAIFPQPDAEVGRVSRDRDALQASVFLPDRAAVSTCLDKYQALLAWSEAGVRSRPVLLSPRSPAREKEFEMLDFPLWLRARKGAGGLMSCLAKTRKEAFYWVMFHWTQGFNTEFIAEEYLPGKDFCFMSLWDEGQLVTSMVRERLTWVGNRLVGTGGTSKLNRVVHSEKVNKASLQAIRTISQKPHGIFCVDLKEDTKGDPHPTEINCRFTTNVHYLTLASIKLGQPELNFAWLAGRLCLGEEIPKCKTINALPANIWFTKNTDMGFTIVDDGHWRAAPFS